MRAWMAVPLIAGCSFSPATTPGNGPGVDGAISDAAAHADAAHDAMMVTPHDGSGSGSACWTFTPTNFDPCQLAPAVASIDMSVPFDGATAPGGKTFTQSDGSTIAVVHLTQLTIGGDGSLVAAGSDRLILAVDGQVTIAGSLVTTAGADTQCGARAGSDGTASSGSNGGGAGGGGGAGAAAGGAASDGTDTGHGSKGAGGTASGADDSALSPLLAGCGGGDGGDQHGSGHAGGGGVGGGAIEISSQQSITVSGKISAAGRGGGASDLATGGGGGGAGGGILLEAPTVSVGANAVLCADGGAGGEGGGTSNGGSAGGNGKCDGTHAAQSGDNYMYGGGGGSGGYANAPAGQPADQATMVGLPAGGGGGGGAVGWIRLRAITTLGVNSGATVTPGARTN